MGLTTAVCVGLVYAASSNWNPGPIPSGATPATGNVAPLVHGGQTCAAGQMVTGFDATGSVVCGDVPAAAAAPAAAAPVSGSVSWCAMTDHCSGTPIECLTGIPITPATSVLDSSAATPADYVLISKIPTWSLANNQAVNGGLINDYKNKWVAQGIFNEYNSSGIEDAPCTNGILVKN